MKKISLLFLVLCLFIVGCNSNTSSDSSPNNQTSTTLEQSTGKPNTSEITSANNTTSQSTSDNQGSTNNESAMDIFINSEDYQNVQKINDYGFYRFEADSLEKKLSMPSTNVNSLEELVDVLDYCAFYHIEEIEISSNLSSFDTSFNKAYWSTSLLPGTVGVDYTKNGSEITISFFYADPAKFTFNNDDRKSITPYKFPLLYSYSRGESFEDFPYLSRENELSVYNSEQLVYALCKGYKPICVKDSPAERVLIRAKEILRDIISPEFTDIDKVVAIYNYITSNVIYDSIGDSAFVYGDYNEIFKDEIIASTASNYVEGALFDGSTVCHGNAKLTALLLNIEGIESYKVSGYYAEYYNGLETRNPIVDGGYYEHGYCYTKIGDNFYITDPTYAFGGGYPNFTFKRDQAILMNKNDWKNVYKLCDDYHNDKYPCIDASLFGTDIAFLEASNGNKVRLHITREEDMTKVIEAIEYLLKQNPNNSYAFVVQVSKTDYDLYRNMVINSSLCDKLNYLQIVNNIGSDYALVFGVNS